MVEAGSGWGRTADASLEAPLLPLATTGRSLSDPWDFVMGSSGISMAGVGLIGKEALVKHDKCSNLPPVLVSMHHSTTPSEGG